MGKRKEKLRFKSFTRDQTCGFIALSVGYISMFCPAILIDPFFPPEARRHGVTASLSGMVLSVTWIAMACSSPFIGVLITWAGPKAILLIGIVLNAVGFTAFGLLEYFQPLQWFVGGAFVTLAISAFGGACVYTSTLTFAAKLFPANTSLVIGATESFIAVAEVISLLSGGFLHDVGGFHLPFMFFGVIHAMSLPVCYMMLPKYNRKPEPSILKELQRLEKGDTAEVIEKKVLKPWNLLQIPRTMLMALVILVTGVFWSFLGANLEEHLSPLELTKTETNLMFILTAVWYGITCPIAGWIADKIPRTWPMISIGLFGSSLACPLLGPLPIFGLENTIWLNVIALTIVTIFLAAATVPSYEAAVLYTIEAGYEDDVTTYAVASSLITTSFALGSFVGAFIGGFMVESIGFPMTASIFGGVILIWSGIVTIYFTCCYTAPRKNADDIRGDSLKYRLRRKSLRGSISDSPHNDDDDESGIELNELEK